MDSFYFKEAAGGRHPPYLCTMRSTNHCQRNMELTAHVEASMKPMDERDQLWNRKVVMTPADLP